MISKKIIFLLLVIFSGAAIYYLSLFFFHPLTDIKPDENINNFKECVDFGYPILESYPRQCRTDDGRVFSEDIGNELEKENIIRIFEPRPNQVISSPLEIRGEARGFWFFEADFPIKIFDENNNLLGLGIARAKGDWMTEEFVSFEAVLEFEAVEEKKGILILEKDNPSGLPEHSDQLILPVFFEETIVVKAFFSNEIFDPEFSCYKVFPAERRIFKTQAVAKSSLKELLKGVTEKEQEKGFFTSINPGVKIQKLTIENGTAMVDFDEQIEFQVGGSCRVSAIRAQIEETLKQFSTVDEVIISVNGRVEDILQP